MINNSHQVKVVINSDNLWAELNWLDDIYQYEMNGTYYIRTWTTESDDKFWLNPSLKTYFNSCNTKWIDSKK